MVTKGLRVGFGAGLCTGRAFDALAEYENLQHSSDPTVTALTCQTDGVPVTGGGGADDGTMGW